MIPLSDENPTLRRPVMTYALLAAIVIVWIVFQGAGLDEMRLAASVCNLGLVPGELTKQAAVGFALPIGRGIACVVDREPINALTPLTSMFLHGSWGHLLGNGLFLLWSLLVILVGLQMAYWFRPLMTPGPFHLGERGLFVEFLVIS